MPSYDLLTICTHFYSSQPDSMLPSEVGAAVSVLLGFSPPLTLSAAGSSKVIEILIK